MTQIAYKVLSADDLSEALNSVLSQDDNFIIGSIPCEPPYTEIISFAFSSEPHTYFSLCRGDLSVRSSSYPYNDDTKKQSIFFIDMYTRPNLEEEEYIPYLPYTLDYQCTSGAGVASSSYFGNTSGTLKLLNILPISINTSTGEELNNEYYIFFGEDWFAIIRYLDGSILDYIICSCRSEQDGDGGYILSSRSLTVRTSDNKVFNNIYTSALLCYYNKFGTYSPNYPVDYIDVSYCNIPYSSLNSYQERIPPTGIYYTSIVYSFKKNWYAHCTCSLLFDSSFTNKLPNYNNLVQYLDEQNSPTMSNTLNGISLLLPNYFYIDVAPLSTHQYKYVLDTPEMCYCSMYNMLSGKIVEQNYPIRGNKFMCFSLSTANEKARKDNYYKGLAFKLPIRYDEIIEDDLELEPIEE